MRILVSALCAVVLVAACGRAPVGTLANSGDYKLYEAATTQSTQVVSVIDSRSHSVERRLPLGTPSPDWNHLYWVHLRTLVEVDPKTGATLSAQQLPGDFQLPPATLSGVPGGLSQNGRWLVLQAFDRTSGSVPTATHLLLTDTSYSAPIRRIDLQGYFQFDAVDNNGLWIYLIQYVSSTEYYVRRYDMAAAQLDPTVIFDKSDGIAAMSGLRLSGVASADGHWLFSVYARQDNSPFIHMLSLDNPIAFCIDLPGLGLSSDPTGMYWSLALSHDGSHLYAANLAKGVVVDVNTGGNGLPSIARTAQIASAGSAEGVQAKTLGANGTALSPDGKTLVTSGAGVLWLDTATLRAQSRQLTDWTVGSLALSPDGSKLYAVNEAGRIAELSMRDQQVANTFGGDPGRPLALIRVEAPAA